MSPHRSRSIVPVPRRVGALAASAGLAAGAAAVADLPVWAPPQLQVRANIVDGYRLPSGSSIASSTPALADDGPVSMRVLILGGGGLFGGLWYGPGDGTGGSVAFTASGESTCGDPSFGADGRVAFEVYDIFSEGLRIHDPVAGTNDLVVPPALFNAASDPILLDDGRLVFRAGDFSGNRWVIADGPALTVVAQEGAGGIAFLFTPDATPAGRIVGKVRLGSTAGSSPDEIRSYAADGSFTILVEDDDADPASPFTGFDNSVAALADGRVAFVATRPDGTRGVYLTDGSSPPVEIATEADPDLLEIRFFPPDANTSGLVVFRAISATGGDSVYAGDGTRLVRVIGEHDLVDTDLGPGRLDQNDPSFPIFGGAPTLNEAGDVAVNAGLTPADDDQVEWGTGVLVLRAVAGDPADLDGDGAVGFGDLLVLLAAFGDAGGPADLDGDGTVAFADLLILLSAWTD